MGSLALANGIDNGALSTIHHLSAPAGRSGGTGQHDLSVTGPVSTGNHDCLGAGGQGVAGSNPVSPTENVQVRAGVAFGRHRLLALLLINLLLAPLDRGVKCALFRDVVSPVDPGGSC